MLLNNQHKTYEMEVVETSEQCPELALCLAIVEAAIYDVRRRRRGRRAYEDESLFCYYGMLSSDAKDFLLNRINDEDNIWGSCLREHGMRQMTKARLAQVVKRKPKISDHPEAA